MRSLSGKPLAEFSAEIRMAVLSLVLSLAISERSAGFCEIESGLGSVDRVLRSR